MNTPETINVEEQQLHAQSGLVLSFLLEQFQRDLWALAQVLPTQHEAAVEEIGAALEMAMRKHMYASEHHARVVRQYYIESLRVCVQNVQVIAPTPERISTH